MGMSASQMRYCMLTGRKTDVEFQGQQINQQRTTLATQSSSYNNQLLDLTVPTPPSTDDYTTTTYTFTSAVGETCTITGSQYNSLSTTTADGTDPGKWTINYTTSSVGDEGKIYARATVLNTVGTYSINGNALTQVSLSSLTGAGPATTEDTQDYSNIFRICHDAGILTTTSGTPPVTTVITDPTAAQAANNFYKYTSDGVTKYVLASDISDITSGNSEANYTYYVDTDAAITTSGKLTNAAVTFSDSGRMTSVTVEDTAGNEIPYSLNVSTENDESAYTDAYNEYEYQKSLYEQDLNNINSQINNIEQQDKKLELKLQDLDTQQQAITTEMESVKKVIDKNIESSFKAFG